MLSHKIMGVVVAIPLLLSTCFADGVKCRITSYSATVAECGNSRGVTASGEKVRPGIVAADWRVFPPGSLLFCNETRELWVVGDTGGAIHGTRIDRFVRTHKEMRNYSSGKLTVSVLYKPNHSGRKTAHTEVHKSFAIRSYIIGRKSEYVSRSGKIDRSKLIAVLRSTQKDGIVSIPKTDTEQKEKVSNGKSSVRRGSNRNPKGKTVVGKSVRDRNCTAPYLYFKPWNERQSWSSFATEGSECYFRCNFATIDFWNSERQSKEGLLPWMR